jgi:murein DD-endopeptidase MepM/ murein hydrolase activator NlpD
MHNKDKEVMNNSLGVKNLPLFFIFGIAIPVMASFISCSTSQRGVFAKKTPHELYEKRLTDAGLKTTALGASWMDAAKKALQQPVAIQLPYKETGYFAAEQPSAFGYEFQARRGEKITITVLQDTALSPMIFADLWRMQENGAAEMLRAADSVNQPITYEVKKDGPYILRVQPELLQSGAYTVTITTGPSLAFPVPSGERATVGSFWGASRDHGARKHEGIDIFGKRGMPVVAAADGYITAVREGGIGGKVVFLHPSGKDYTLYYAHLDSQTVREGQFVKTGEVVGLMGNTGNAKYTAPHLHFGIYAAGGAVDPLPFVKAVTTQPKEIAVPFNVPGKFLRSTKVTALHGTRGDVPAQKIKANTPLRVIGATSSWYKVELPHGEKALVAGSDVTKANSPVGTHRVTSKQLLLDAPRESAPAKRSIEQGTTIDVYGAFGDYLFVAYQGLNGWIHKD